MKKFRFIFIVLLIWVFSIAASAAEFLIPGGQVIGLQLTDDTVTIAAFEETFSPAQKAGLKEGDQILQINGKKITCVDDVRQVLSKSDAQVKISVLRNGKTKNIIVAPAVSADGPKLGVYLKQGITGVGTVTYYDTDGEEFAALGHGVNTQSGNLLRLKTGSIYKAGVLSVKKGTVGTPGQLFGSLVEEQSVGVIEKNTNQGVFGKLATEVKGEPLPVAEKEDVHTGQATIRSTVDGTTLQEYSVEILKIYPNSKERTRNMLIKVTDPKLLQATGGIVQGMSGSPIIQNGKLIGAVTHVLVNDPTTGYGIFIENMLDAAA